MSISSGLSPVISISSKLLNTLISELNQVQLQTIVELSHVRRLWYWKVSNVNVEVLIYFKYQSIYIIKSIPASKNSAWAEANVACPHNFTSFVGVNHRRPNFLHEDHGAEEEASRGTRKAVSERFISAAIFCSKQSSCFCRTLNLFT